MFIVIVKKNNDGIYVELPLLRKGTLSGTGISFHFLCEGGEQELNSHFSGFSSILWAVPW